MPTTAKISDIVVKGRIRKNLQDIKSFAASIKEKGLIQPVVLKRLTNGKYELVAGQSPIEASYCIDKLTLQNDLIFDPFLGEGTTALAAMNLHRRFIGIDIDHKAIKSTRANLLLSED